MLLQRHEDRFMIGQVDPRQQQRRWNLGQWRPAHRLQCLLARLEALYKFLQVTKDSLIV